MLQRLYSLLILLCLSAAAMAQTATITGIVRNTNGQSVELAGVSVEGTDIGTKTNAKGSYKLEVPAGRQITVVYTSFMNKDVVRQYLNLSSGEKREINITLKISATELKGITKSTTRNSGEAGSVQLLDVANSNRIAGPQDGLTTMIKSLTGPGRSELTSQYTVRGGNYDENLVYVNDFEIYRPYLIRSGQQEGLTFVNTDLVNNVNFSIGGFQAKYGDKMSSVLDVSYRRPTKFKGTAMASLLGASLSLEGASRDTSFTYMIGIRQKSNQYLLQSQPTKGVYNPSFTDVQVLLNYRINKKLELEAIGNYARNRFSFYPSEMVSSFGAVNEAYQLRVFYTGGEIDQFDSKFGGLSATYKPNNRLRLKLLASGFQTDEKETYDINGEYLLGELETDLGKDNFGQIKTFLGTGIIQTHARNYLKVRTGTFAHRGGYDADRHQLSWGLDATITNISDKLHEWERRDSAGFTQPYNEDLLVMTKFYHSTTEFNFNRYSGFVQDAFHFGSDSSGRLNVVAGVRFNYSDLNGEMIVSPRLQANYRPNWKKDVIFRFATGLYAQPPFYREMRDLEGKVNKDLKAQKSYHIVGGLEHDFTWGGRRLKTTAEVYYKKLWDIVPYEYDDVRIRYYGQNAGDGYAYGGELRLYGELVKDATSWVSIGYMKTQERLNIHYTADNGVDSVVSTGYIPRPTDQRFMFGLFLQDYLPNNKNFKVNMTLMYATGLPFGPPNGRRAQQILRIPDYKRVDIGFSALLLDGAKKERPANSFFRNLESIWASVEVFNLLGIQNTLSYAWIQDQTSGGLYAVPNRLTARLLNVKLIVKF
jgi:hypothetical protein